LMIVQPATVLRWRRQGLRSIWTSGSRGHWRGGRPRVDREIRDLIVRMSHDNFLWGAPRIHGELLKLGFDVSQATVSRYMPRRNRPPSQGWHTFPAESGRWSQYHQCWRSGRASRSDSFSRLRLDRADCPVRNQGAGWPPFRVHRATGHLATWSSHSANRNRRAIPIYPRSAPPCALDDDRSAAFAISLKGIATTTSDCRRYHRACVGAID
jgi:hypothetical protein